MTWIIKIQKIIFTPLPRKHLWDQFFQGGGFEKNANRCLRFEETYEEKFRQAWTDLVNLAFHLEERVSVGSAPSGRRKKTVYSGQGLGRMAFRQRVVGGTAAVQVAQAGLYG